MSLFLRLLELDIFAVGTVKTSVQGFPKKLKISPKEAKITSRGTCTSLVAATAKGPITAFCWMDSKPVYGISTGFMNRPVFIPPPAGGKPLLLGFFFFSIPEKNPYYKGF